MKNVLLVSRSIEPPWDEASRNFVHAVALTLEGYKIHVMTGREGSSICRDNVFDKKIYTRRILDMHQKLRLAAALNMMKNDFDIYHFCFAPEKFSSACIKNIMPLRRGRLRVQSIPYIPDRALNDPKNIIFGDHITVFSKMTKNILRLAGFKNVDLVYPTVDFSLYKPQDKKDESMTILYAGYLPNSKVLNDIYTIIEFVLDRVKNAKFLLAIRTKNMKEVLMKRMMLNRIKGKFMGRACFITSSYDMTDAIRGCDILIYPFLSGFERKIDIPFVIAEAMACAKPVLVSDIEPLNEPFIGQGGKLTRARRAEDFAQEVISLCSDKNTLLQAGGANMQAAFEMFDYRKNLNIIKTIYEKCDNG